MKLRIPPSTPPTTLPTTEAMQSHGDNQTSYEPDFWEFEYAIYRYLAGVSTDSLQSRYEGILKNMKSLVSLNRDVIPIQHFLSSWYWHRKEHQTRLEFFNRGIPLSPPPRIPFDESEGPIPRPRYPNSGDILFRYDQKFFAQCLIEKGEIRIKPAHSNREKSLGRARCDDELTKSIFTPSQHARVTTQDGKNIAVLGDIRRSKIGPDYYMLSMSCDWDPTLKDTFGGSCAIIHDPDTFTARLDLAARPELGDWHFQHGPVEYFDPCELLPNQYFNWAMSKDFHFAYQREYRFLWAPVHTQPTNGFKTLHLGSLSNIASLYS